MARLVREEMPHYEQVLVLMDQMGMDYRHLPPLVMRKPNGRGKV